MPNAVCRRTDARSITTTYEYDALNRLKKKSYSDSTPLVRYLYDGDTPVNGQNDCTVTVSLTVTNGRGRRTGMCDTAGGEAWSYDAAGRVEKDRRTSNGVTKDVTYTYNLDGSPATITYPSGRIVSSTYSAAARLLTVKDTTDPTAINYATGSCDGGACYAPHGGLSSVLLAKVDGGFAGMTNSYSYNSRLQPSAISATSANGTVLSLSYTYVPVSDTSCTTSGTVNNGNVMCITNVIDNNRNQRFDYDYLNRIKVAESRATSGNDCWGHSYTYDSVYPTNLASATVTKTDQSCLQTGFSLSITNKNRFSGTNVTFDNAGNLTNDGLGDTYSWNAENRLTTTNGVEYTYDGDRQRVKKDQSGGSLYDKLYWYGLDGEVLVETILDGTLPREFIYFGGAKIARRESNGTIYYFFADHLGTNRVMTSDRGITQQESTYYPFGGEQRKITDTVDNRWKFTGLERESESGLDLDHTLYRKYASNIARWLSPDPVRGTITNPQSLNRYSYVINNPCNLFDPLGLADSCTLYVKIKDRKKLLTSDETLAARSRLSAILAANQGENSLLVAYEFSGGADFTFNVKSLGKSWAGEYKYGKAATINVGGIQRGFAAYGVQRNTPQFGWLVAGVAAHEFGHKFFEHGLGIMQDPLSPDNLDPTLTDETEFTTEQAEAIFDWCKERHKTPQIELPQPFYLDPGGEMAMIMWRAMMMWYNQPFWFFPSRFPEEEKPEEPEEE